MIKSEPYLPTEEEQKKLDALSDEFMSTFSMLSPNSLVNIASEAELPLVTSLIVKHFGCDDVDVTLYESLDGRSIYEFEMVFTKDGN